MNKQNRGNILHVPEGKPGEKKSWSHFKRLVSCWPGDSHAFVLLLSSWKMTIVRIHANVAQVQSTQTLKGRQEVEYFCQILFHFKFLQLLFPTAEIDSVPAVHHGALFPTFLFPDFGNGYVSSLHNGCCKSSAISDIEHSANFTQIVLIERKPKLPTTGRKNLIKNALLCSFFHKTNARNYICWSPFNQRRIWWLFLGFGTSCPLFASMFLL